MESRHPIGHMSKLNQADDYINLLIYTIPMKVYFPFIFMERTATGKAWMIIFVEKL